MKPRICIIKTDGINCDAETAAAFELVGAQAKITLLNELKEHPKSMHEFDILVIPGGFSYGDDIASGKVLALELLIFLKDYIQEFVNSGKLVLGICNGFQVLVQMGLLPFNTWYQKKATLAHNDSGKFECRWITLRGEKSSCIFTQGLENHEITLPVAHGEGKFWCNQTELDELENNQLIPLRYSYSQKATQDYPFNPNGSLHAIAGVCDTTGRIFGLMPHPERYVYHHQYANWRRIKNVKPHGLLFFENAVRYVR